MKSTNVGIIGLGVIGKRMAKNMVIHPKFRVIGGYDVNENKRSEFKHECKGIKVVTTAEELLSNPKLDLLYVGTPPASHAEYVKWAVEKKLKIFCEKPLGIDEDQSHELIEIVKFNKTFNAVNFVYASAPAADAAKDYISSGEIGDPVGVEISLTFSCWPRKWQADATWLGESAEGGFMREVGSHFLYLSYRLLGIPKWVATPLISRPSPKSAETLFQGICTIDDIPISINGFVGGKLNDIIEWRLRGTRNSLRIKNWYSLERQGNIDWEPLLIGDQLLPQTAYMAQLDRLADQLNKGNLLLPDFYDAFIIQKLVEDGLRNSKELRK